jgi:hypothetical protein
MVSCRKTKRYRTAKPKQARQRRCSGNHARDVKCGARRNLIAAFNTKAFGKNCTSRGRMTQAGVKIGCAFVLLPVWAAIAQAAAPADATKNYPQRPVRIVVNVTAGGGVDALARIAGLHYTQLWGQPFVVDNRVGAGGSIGVELVTKAAPDGYTLLVTSSV